MKARAAPRMAFLARYWVGLRRPGVLGLVFVQVPGIHHEGSCMEIAHQRNFTTKLVLLSELLG